MTSEALCEFLSKKDLGERSRFLTSMSYLTISARDIPNDDLLAKKRLSAFNELQHSLLGQIGHYLDGEEVKVYPLDVFCKIMFSKSENTGLSADLLSAIKFAMRFS